MRRTTSSARLIGSGDMRPWMVGLSVTALLVFGIAGSVAVYVVNPDAPATFTSHITSVIGLGVPVLVGLLANRKTAKQVDKVQEQTNGRLHTVMNDNMRLATLLLKNGVNPYDGKPVVMEKEQ